MGNSWEIVKTNLSIWYFSLNPLLFTTLVNWKYFLGTILRFCDQFFCMFAYNKSGASIFLLTWILLKTMSRRYFRLMQQVLVIQQKFVSV